VGGLTACAYPAARQCMKNQHQMTSLLIAAILLLGVILGSAAEAGPPEKTASGIIEYQFEPNPQEPTAKMFNWEVLLSAADSTNGIYRVVQISKPLEGGAEPSDTKTKILIDQDMDKEPMIAPDRQGIVHFMVHIGDKEPTQNMNGPAQLGYPIIFSGRGTGKGQSDWIVLPGSRVERVTPSAKGTQLLGGRLCLIQFIVVNERDEKFQAEVMLQRK
jgi:hypothetical protein